MGILGSPDGILGPHRPDLGPAHGNFGIFPGIWEFLGPLRGISGFPLEFWEFCPPLTVLTPPPHRGHPKPSPPSPKLVSTGLYWWGRSFSLIFAQFRALLAQTPPPFRAGRAPSASGTPNSQGKTKTPQPRGRNPQERCLLHPAGAGGAVWGKKEPNWDFQLRGRFFFFLPLIFFGWFWPQLEWLGEEFGNNEAAPLWGLDFQPFRVVFFTHFKPKSSFLLGLFNGVFLGGFLQNRLVLG